ncbi:MAG: hypothetical protein ABSC64_02295 [Candidatus Korobacteraceae bacterium]|jgi:hypothetical protein
MNESSFDAMDAFCGDCDRVCEDDCAECEKQYKEQIDKLEQENEAQRRFCTRLIGLLALAREKGFREYDYIDSPVLLKGQIY